MPGEQVSRRSWRCGRNTQQVHLGLFNRPPSLAVVAVRAGSHEICPGMLSPKMAWDYMVNREGLHMLATVLADEIIPAQNLPLGQLDLWTGAANHLFKADNRGTREYLPDSLDLSSPIQDHGGFSIDDEGDSPAGIADIDRFKVGV